MRGCNARSIGLRSRAKLCNLLILFFLTRVYPYSRGDNNATAVPLSNGPRKILRETWRAHVAGVASSAELRSNILCKNVRALARARITRSAKLIEKQTCVWSPSPLQPFAVINGHQYRLLARTSYRDYRERFARCPVKSAAWEIRSSLNREHSYSNAYYWWD